MYIYHPILIWSWCYCHWDITFLLDKHLCYVHNTIFFIVIKDILYRFLQRDSKWMPWCNIPTMHMKRTSRARFTKPPDISSICKMFRCHCECKRWVIYVLPWIVVCWPLCIEYCYALVTHCWLVPGHIQKWYHSSFCDFMSKMILLPTLINVNQRMMSQENNYVF